MPHAPANGIELYYEAHGPEEGEPVLLVMGLGAQMTRWPEGMWSQLVDRGCRVIRFDNRDVGLSSKIEAAGAIDLGQVVKALAAGQKPETPYTLDDLAADAIGLLDHLGVARAHVVGASMGGMIVQLMAADYPDRVLSLTSIMSTTGNPALPRGTPEALAALANRPPDPARDLEAYVAHSLNSARATGSPGYPQDEAQLRERILSDFRRCYHPAGFSRQYAGILASPDRRPKLRTVKAPTVVLHGADDPLVPAAGGRDTAENIPGAELRVIPGMGHDVPPGLYDVYVDAIMAAVARGRAQA